jgi:hypothetical protein
MNGINGEQKTNPHKASKKSGCPPSNCRRWNKAGHTTAQQVLGSRNTFKRYLSDDEETEICDWVLGFAAQHLCVSLDQFTLKVDQIMERLERLHRGESKRTSQTFMDSFLKRHPEIEKKNLSRDG